MTLPDDRIETVPGLNTQPSTPGLLRRVYVQRPNGREEIVPDLMALHVDDVFRMSPPYGMTLDDDPRCPIGRWIVTGEPRVDGDNQRVRCEPFPELPRKGSPCRK